MITKTQWQGILLELGKRKNSFCPIYYNNILINEINFNASMFRLGCKWICWGDESLMNQSLTDVKSKFKVLENVFKEK